MPHHATNSGKDLSEIQALAIPHLVSAKSAGETAEFIGVNRKTGEPAPCLFRDLIGVRVMPPHIEPLQPS